MAEIELIKITYSPSENAIDFGVPGNADELIVEKDKEIIRMLRHLADCLERREYPFSNLHGDTNKTK